MAGWCGSAVAADAVDPGDDGRTLALELLLRLWQRSQEGPLQRAAGAASLLLVELPMEVMSEKLPQINPDDAPPKRGPSLPGWGLGMRHPAATG